MVKPNVSNSEGLNRALNQRPRDHNQPQVNKAKNFQNSSGQNAPARRNTQYHNANGNSRGSGRSGPAYDRQVSNNGSRFRTLGEERPVICFYCGVPGHTKSVCRFGAKVTCRGGGQKGHKQKYCKTE